MMPQMIEVVHIRCEHLDVGLLDPYERDCPDPDCTTTRLTMRYECRVCGEIKPELAYMMNDDPRIAMEG